MPTLTLAQQPSTSMPATIVIIGGGHAGGQAARRLAASGHAGRVTLVCEEPELPYHRPPLSKAFLKDFAEELQPLRSAASYEEDGLHVLKGDPVVAIDRAARTVQTQSGARLGYDRLIFATGARPRVLPSIPTHCANVLYLRSAEDALKLRSMLRAAKTITVLGGGFIGLEIAATAAVLGKSVTVIEAGARLLARSASYTVSAHIQSSMESDGVEFHLSCSVHGVECEGDRVSLLRTNSGDSPVELLVVGIGAVPEIALAQPIGLECGAGILVNEHLQTSDPSIFAIGDCSEFPVAAQSGRRRLESVQNANDQAAAVAATLTGTPTAYDAKPWFWSQFGTVALQIAGQPDPGADCLRWNNSKPGSFSVLQFMDGKLSCVESVNAPADHMAARSALSKGKLLPRESFEHAKPLTPLRSLL